MTENGLQEEIALSSTKFSWQLPTRRAQAIQMERGLSLKGDCIPTTCSPLGLTRSPTATPLWSTQELDLLSSGKLDNKEVASVEPASATPPKGISRLIAVNAALGRELKLSTQKSTSTMLSTTLNERSQTLAWRRLSLRQRVRGLVRRKTPPSVSLPSKRGKPNYRLQFQSLLQKHQIINGAHYEIVLQREEELRKLEMNLPAHQIEPLKKLMFRQIFLLMDEKMPLPKRLLQVPTYSNFSTLKRTYTMWMSKLAVSNSISLKSILSKLKCWLLNLNKKRHGLVLIGKPDSGKSFLADLLLSLYEPFEIGYFACPMSSHISPFLFQGLINKLVYRCDELVLEQLGFVQSFKQLTEGSKTLQTDVKFKDALPVDSRPVIVTMNGDCPRDLLKFHPQEFEAVSNRCVFLQMDESIRSIFNNRQLDQLRGRSCSISGLNFI